MGENGVQNLLEVRVQYWSEFSWQIPEYFSCLTVI